LLATRMLLEPSRQDDVRFPEGEASMKTTEEDKDVVQLAQKRVNLVNILVPTDFSPSADSALAYAMTLAKRYDSRIYLAHVLTPNVYAAAPAEVALPMHGALRQAAEERMAEVLISGRLREVPHEVILEEGVLWPAIERLIAKYEIDFIVAGTHGARKLEKVMLGSGAEEILRHAACPVMTVGPRFSSGSAPSAEWKNILLAADLQRRSEKAASYALAFAQEFQAHVTLLHIIEQAPRSTDLELPEKREAALQRLAQLVPQNTTPWCEPEFLVEFGPPAEAILRTAKSRCADLIVMGAKTRHRFGSHNPYTTAYRVLSDAKCPVLTVRE
jgi:nucleotide-binding universal stress UspA family protein